MLVLEPLQIPPGPNTSVCPSGLVLRPGARRVLGGRDNPKPRRLLQREILIFHFQLCAMWMGMMQLAQAGAVWGFAFAGVSRNTGAVFFCFLCLEAAQTRSFRSAAPRDALSLGKQLGRNNKEFCLVEKVVAALPALKIKTMFQSKMPIQADIKEKNASRSGSLISMALAFVIHMSGAVMTYMPIGNNGAEGQQGHKGKASRGGRDRTDPLCRVGPLEVGWCHSEHGLLFSHSGVPINGNLVESPAWVEGFGNDAHGGLMPEGSSSLSRSF